MDLVSIPATPIEFAAILTSLSIEMVLFFSILAIQSCMDTRQFPVRYDPVQNDCHTLPLQLCSITTHI